jgi:tRNA(Glu) U13 pseudouridine synthase TruD
VRPVKAERTGDQRTRAPKPFPGSAETYLASVDEHGPHITVAITLPAGSFATVLMRELTKDRPGATAAGDESEPQETEVSAE